MNVIAIALKLREMISVYFVPLHDCLCSGDCSKYFGESQLSKTMLEIGFFLVFLHTFKLGFKSSVDVAKVAIHAVQLRIAVLLMQDHPKIEAQVAVTPFVNDSIQSNNSTSFAAAFG